MRTKYKWMLLILLVEYVCLVVTSKLGIKIESTIGSIIILLLIMGPGLILLYWLSGDENICLKYRILWKVLLVFLLLCYVAGIVVKVLGLES